MVKKSAGILLFRSRAGELEVLLVHPGGPYWINKDQGAWSIPKGEIQNDEDPIQAAIREAEEEIGLKTRGELIPLTPVKQKAGKIIIAWAAEGDFNIEHLQSNTFEMLWPPKSSNVRTFPEIDKAQWFDIITAKLKIIQGQIPLLEELEKIIRTQKK